MSPKNTLWKKPRKEASRKEITHRYFIFCEGEKTEPYYFGGFKNLIEKNTLYKNTVHIEIKGLGKETMRVAHYAHEYIVSNSIKNASIWCVYDKDDFPKDDFDNASKVAESYNNNEDSLVYKCAWSNQCIEYWFILHFAYYDSDNDRKDYIEFLNKEFTSKKLPKYKKNNKEIFNILLNNGDPKQAIKFAKKRISECKKLNLPPSKSSPATTVYELVEELAEYLPESEKSKFL